MNGSSHLLRLSLIALAACVHVPRVAPAARNPETQASTVVSVQSSCGHWNTRSGSGVIVSERHVLTAVTIVSCVNLPRVHVTYRHPRGEHQLRMVVTREDRATGIARLEIASADSFRLDIKPPLVRQPDPGSVVCAHSAARRGKEAACGTVASTWHVVKRLATNAVDDGAPVYGRFGKLVGLVVNRGASTLFPYTWIAPVDETWLEGVVLKSPPPPPATAHAASIAVHASE